MEDTFDGNLRLSGYIKIRKRKCNFPLLSHETAAPYCLWRKKAAKKLGREINAKNYTEMERSCSLKKKRKKKKFSMDPYGVRFLFCDIFIKVMYMTVHLHSAGANCCLLDPSLLCTENTCFPSTLPSLRVHWIVLLSSDRNLLLLPDRNSWEYSAFKSLSC